MYVFFLFNDMNLIYRDIILELPEKKLSNIDHLETNQI